MCFHDMDESLVDIAKIFEDLLAIKQHANLHEYPDLFAKAINAYFQTDLAAMVYSADTIPEQGNQALSLEFEHERLAWLVLPKELCSAQIEKFVQNAWQMLCAASQEFQPLSYDKGHSLKELLSSHALHIFDRIPAGIVIHASNGQIEYCNSMASKILQLSTSSVLGKNSDDPVWSMIDEDGNPVGGDEHPAMYTLRTGKALRNVVRGVYADKPSETRWLLISTEPLYILEQASPHKALAIFSDLTALRQAERQQAQLAQFIDNSQQFIAVADLDGSVFFLNRFARHMLGLESQQSVVHLHIQDFLPHEERRHITDDLIPHIQKGGLWRTRTKLMQFEADSLLDVEINAFLIRSHVSKKALAMAVVMYDISDHVKALEKLKKSEETFRALAESTQDGVIRLDRTMHLLYFNQAAQRFFKSLDDSLLGKKADCFFSDQALLAEITQEFTNALDIREPQHFEVNLQEEYWLEINMVPELIKTSYASGVIFVIRDISERKLAESMVKETLQLSADIIDTIPSGLFIYQYYNDDLITLVDANPAAQKLVGVEITDVIGKDMRELWPNADKGTFYQTVLDVCHDGQTRMLTEYEYKDAAVYGFFHIHLFQMPGNKLGVAFENITKMKQAELERKRLTEQLQQSQKMEAIGKLAGGVAHDFNNLLTSISGNIFMALQEVDRRDPLHDLLQEVAGAGERAAALVKQLLAFSRKQIMEQSVIYLNELLDRLVRMLERIIGETIHIEIRYGENLWPIKADANQIEQVIINMVVNAKDAMPEGGTLVIETQNISISSVSGLQGLELEHGDYVSLSIEDNGIGMSKEVQEQIFEPFFTTKPLGQGTGLGMATVYGVLTQHQASIQLESAPGVGSCFSIYFPRSLQKEIETKSKTQSPKHDLSGKETILVVEDEPLVKNIVDKMLSRKGYTVHHCASGDEALSFLNSGDGAVDLVLTDMVMPGMNGIQLAKQIWECWPKIKILFTSGYAEEEISLHGGYLHEHNFLAKPYSPDVLALKVRNLLDDS